MNTSIHQAASEAILEQRGALADALVALEFARHPELEQRYGRIGREKSLQDAGFHLAYLAEALALNNRALFIDYCAWAKVVLGQRNVRAEDFAFHLECTGAVLDERLPGEFGRLAGEFVEAALRALPAMPDDLATFLPDHGPLSALAHQYVQALLRAERHVASQLILGAVERGTPVKDIYLQVFQPAQYEVGRLWQLNRISVAQEHYCTAATQLIMSQLYSHVFTAERNGHTLAVTCVEDDLHELGARMVADFFEMAGWNTFFTGANTPTVDVIRTVIERKVDVLAISVTIAHHLGAVRTLIAAVRARPECRAVKILVGGYPFNQDPGLWQQVGADGCGVNAAAAIATAERLIAPHEGSV